MSFRSELIKLSASLSILLTGISIVNAPIVHADEVEPGLPETTSLTSPAPKKDDIKLLTEKKKDDKADKIVKLAKKQVGKPYVYGATGPNAFDCSGLVQYVYKKATNETLPRTTFSQVHQGKKVSINHLKKGDLLFWGSVLAPYHVGIYVGNGQYVHAATPSQGVRKQSLSTYFYPSAAKRVLK